MTTTDNAPAAADPFDPDELKVTIPGLPAGSHEVELAGVEPAVWSNETTGEILRKFALEWRTELEDGRQATIVQRTGRIPSPRSRLLEVLVALCGPAAVTPTTEIDLRELVGRRAILTVELAEGRSRVAAVTAIPRRGRG